MLDGLQFFGKGDTKSDLLGLRNVGFKTIEMDNPSQYLSKTDSRS